MPNRLLKEGICTSDAINSLSSDSEVLFYRLLVVSDDFGRMDARVPILKGECFPLKESATVAKIEKWLQELVNHGLISLYKSNGKPFLHIKKWDQRQRSHAKYPDPSTADGEQLSADCGQVTADCGLGLGLGEGKGMGKGKTKPSRADGAGVFPEIADRQLVTDWLKVRKLKKLATTDTALQGFMREVKKSGLSLEAVLKKCCEKGWGGFEAKWLQHDYGPAKKPEKFDPFAYVNRLRKPQDEIVIEH